MQFKLFGFPITVTAGSLLISALIGYSFGFSTGIPGAGVVGAVLVFGSIFLHELGHAFAARRVGSQVLELQMNGLGGFVRHSGKVGAPASFFITAAGPFMNLLLIGTGLLLINFMPYYWLGLLVFFNILLLILNLLPVVPLDGGRMLHSFLTLFYADTKGGVIRPRKKWRYTPDQITGAVGVVIGVLWIPLLVLMYLNFGVIIFFFPPIAFSFAMAKGEAKLPL